MVQVETQNLLNVSGQVNLLFVLLQPQPLPPAEHDVEHPLCIRVRRPLSKKIVEKIRHNLAVFSYERIGMEVDEGQNERKADQIEKARGVRKPHRRGNVDPCASRLSALVIRNPDRVLEPLTFPSPYLVKSFLQIRLLTKLIFVGDQDHLSQPYQPAVDVLRYQVSGEKGMWLLRGGPVYDDPGVVWFVGAWDVEEWMESERLPLERRLEVRPPSNVYLLLHKIQRLSQKTNLPHQGHLVEFKRIQVVWFPCKDRLTPVQDHIPGFTYVASLL